MTTAFVLSGGASLGAVQVGMLRALDEAGVHPDLIIGTSVGAVNGAWLAGHPGQGTEGLADIWRSLRRADVFPAEFMFGFLGFTGRRRGLVSNHRLRSLVERNLTFERLEDAPTPLSVVVADVLNAHDVRLTTGKAADAVLASAAIPGVFPPVTIDGRTFMDGGVLNNTPISHAAEAGATTIWVLSTGYACALERAPRGALAMALHGLGILVQQRLVADIDRYEDEVDLRVLPPLCPNTVSPADFTQGEVLMDRAYQASVDWLESAGSFAGKGQSAQHAFHPH